MSKKPLPTKVYYGWTLRFRNPQHTYPGRYYQMVPKSWQPVPTRMEGHVWALFPSRAEADRAAADNPDIFFKTPIRIKVTFEPVVAKEKKKKARLSR